MGWGVALSPSIRRDLTGQTSYSSQDVGPLGSPHTSQRAQEGSVTDVGEGLPEREWKAGGN